VFRQQDYSGVRTIRQAICSAIGTCIPIIRLFPSTPYVLTKHVKEITLSLINSSEHVCQEILEKIDHDVNVFCILVATNSLVGSTGNVFASVILRLL